MASVQCETLLVKYMLLTFIILDSEKVSHISIPRVNVVESNVKVKKTHHKFGEPKVAILIVHPRVRLNKKSVLIQFI